MWSFLAELLKSRQDIFLLLRRIPNLYRFSPQQWLAVAVMIVPMLLLAFFLGVMFHDNFAQRKSGKSVEQQQKQPMEALKRAFADVDRTFAPPTREEQQREKERSLILRQYEAEEQAYNAGSDATPSPDLLKRLQSLQ
jgi:hypothetical protein